MVLQLSLPLTWTHHHHFHHRTRRSLLPLCALTKHGHRHISSLDAAPDTTAAHRLIRKFVASSSKSVALNAFSHLLSSDVHRHSSLALPMYERISETNWFNWNPKLVSNLIASLEKQQRFDEAEILISESVHKLGFQERELVMFYCNLIESFAKHGSKRGVFDSFSRLKELISSSTFPSSNRKAFESMINALCTLELPTIAEEMMEEMRNAGFKPSGFEFRSIVHCYGRAGLFTEMTRVLGEMESCGCTLDTICANVVLSSYGAHGELSEMVSWIRKMKTLNILFSIRTYNSVLNSCPTIMKLVQDPESVPLSIEELMEKLKKDDEALLVEELIGSSVLVENLDWGSTVGRLDLHGMHLGAVYVMMLQWVEELRWRFRDGNSIVIPVEIVVVCGLGKHSSVRGGSPVKGLVLEMMSRWGSPMRIERKKGGSFVAKGRNVKNWLCQKVASDWNASIGVHVRTDIRV